MSLFVLVKISNLFTASKTVHVLSRAKKGYSQYLVVHVNCKTGDKLATGMSCDDIGTTMYE